VWRVRVRSRGRFRRQHNERRQQHIGAVKRHSVALWALDGRAPGARFAAAMSSTGRRPLPEVRRLYRAAKVCLNVLNFWNVPGTTCARSRSPPRAA